MNGNATRLAHSLVREGATCHWPRMWERSPEGVAGKAYLPQFRILSLAPLYPVLDSRSVWWS